MFEPRGSYQRTLVVRQTAARLMEQGVPHGNDFRPRRAPVARRAPGQCRVTTGRANAALLCSEILHDIIRPVTIRPGPIRPVNIRPVKIRLSSHPGPHETAFLDVQPMAGAGNVVHKGLKTRSKEEAQA